MRIRSEWMPWRLFARSALRLGAVGAALLYTTGAVLEGTATRRADVATPPEPFDRRSVDELSRRATWLGASLEDLETFWSERVRPLERELARYTPDADLARDIAVALVREGRSAGVDPHLLLSVLLVENPWLAPEAVSPVGAVGLMQVMPVHAGGWGCASDDLRDLDVNICHGARILAHYLSMSEGNLDRALLRYNGCMNGTNTPDCGLYPMKVYRNASLAIFRDAP